MAKSLLELTRAFIVYSVLVLGAKRSGKWWGIRKTYREWSRDAMGSVVALIPHPGENLPVLIKDLHEYGLEDGLYADSLDDPLHCLPLIRFPKSRDPDPYARAMRNADYQDGLLELLGRNRRDPIEQQVTVIELATHAIQLCHEAQINVGFEHLMAVGKEGHPLFHELLDNCANDELTWFWTSIPKQGAVVRKDLSALWRLTEQKFGDPRILTRTTADDRFSEMLRAGISIAVEGARSKRATRTYLGLLGMSLNQAIYDHFADTGQELPVLQISDEVQSYGLFTSFEANTLREQAKMGLRSIFIAHGPRLLADEDDNAEALQNFDVFAVHRCNDYRTAFECSQLLIGAELDPWMEHSRQERRVIRHRGFEEIDVISKSTGFSGDRETSSTSIGKRLVPRYEDDIEETIRYMPLEDQVKYLASKLMRLGVGERFVRV